MTSRAWRRRNAALGTATRAPIRKATRESDGVVRSNGAYILLLLQRGLVEERLHVGPELWLIAAVPAVEQLGQKRVERRGFGACSARLCFPGRGRWTQGYLRAHRDVGTVLIHRLILLLMRLSF